MPLWTELTEKDFIEGGFNPDMPISVAPDGHGGVLVRGVITQDSIFIVPENFRPKIDRPWRVAKPSIEQIWRAMKVYASGHVITISGTSFADLSLKMEVFEARVIEMGRPHGEQKPWDR